MVEWYEAYADYLAVAERFERLMAALGVPGPWRREKLVEAIKDRTGIDVMAHHDRDALAAEMRSAGLEVPEEDTWAGLVDELVSKHVEPTLSEPTLLLDYPVELSPFAKAHRSEPGLVERFEAYVGGMEIANAFTELNDPDEQRARFRGRRPAAGRGVPVRARARDAPDRRDRDRDRPAGDGADRAALDPRGRAVPGDAGLGRPPGPRAAAGPTAAARPKRPPGPEAAFRTYRASSV